MGLLDVERVGAGVRRDGHRDRGDQSPAPNQSAAKHPVCSWGDSGGDFDPRRPFLTVPDRSGLRRQTAQNRAISRTLGGRPIRDSNPCRRRERAVS